MASSAVSPSRYSQEAAVARTAVKLATSMCKAAQLELQELKRQHLRTEKLVATTALRCQALLALMLQQGLSNQLLRFTAATDFAVLRAPQSTMTAKSIQQGVNEVLSGEPGYQAATDAEFEDLLWAGFSCCGKEGSYWIMNPIDDIEGFENLQQYGVSLALLEDGKVVLATLACPNLPVEPILAITRMKGADGRRLEGSDPTATTPSSVSKPLEQAEGPNKTGCLFTAVQDQGAFQAALFTDNGQAQSDHIRLPMRPFFPPETEAYFHSITSTSWCQWARDYPRQQTFALVSPRESKFHSPGHHYPDNNTTVLLLDGQAQYGALSRGDAKVLLMGGQDDIWDHAAGILIAQESGFLVMNGAGAALDTGCGTKLNCDRGVLATHPFMHADVVKRIMGTITLKAQEQWLSAIIESGTASSAALRMAADNYQGGNYHNFIVDLEEAANRSKRKLSIQRAMHLVNTLRKGPAAVQSAVAQQSISCAEIEALLQLSCEAANGLTARSLGCNDACTYNEFTDESSSD